MCLSVCVCLLPRTLLHHVEGEDGAVVAVLLLGVLGEADVLALVLEGDVPQQDGDVLGLGGAHKVHTVVEHADLIGLHPLHGDHRLTQLHTHRGTHTQPNVNAGVPQG